MARRKSADYIPSSWELQCEVEERKAYVEEYNKKLPVYKLTYKIHGTEQSEEVQARTSSEAVEHLKQQWNMVGLHPYDITSEQINSGSLGK